VQAPRHICEYYGQARKLVWDKRSSLFRPFVSDREKSVFDIDAGLYGIHDTQVQADEPLLFWAHCSGTPP